MFCEFVVGVKTTTIRIVYGWKMCVKTMTSFGIKNLCSTRVQKKYLLLSDQTSNLYIFLKSQFQLIYISGEGGLENWSLDLTLKLSQIANCMHLKITILPKFNGLYQHLCSYWPLATWLQCACAMAISPWQKTQHVNFKIHPSIAKCSSNSLFS